MKGYSPLGVYTYSALTDQTSLSHKLTVLARSRDAVVYTLLDPEYRRLSLQLRAERWFPTATTDPSQRSRPINHST